MNKSINVVASLISGGEARRFQGTFKPLLEIKGRTLLSRLTRSLSSQVNEIIINTNKPVAIGPERGMICVLDRTAGLSDELAGPLQGVAASLRWLKTHRTNTQWLATLPGDTLEIPPDFVTKLLNADCQQQPRYAICNGKHHYLAALWHIDQLEQIVNFLKSGHRAVKHYHRTQGSVAVEFEHPTPTSQEYFFNINTAHDYQYALDHYD